MEARFSYFNPPVYKKNPTPAGVCTIGEVYREIKSDSLKSITANIRESKNKGDQNKLKQSELPYVTFGGTFTYRSNKDLISRSCLMVLDVDHLGAKVEEIRIAILNEIRPALLFKSPSGMGLKIVCSIDQVIEHSVYFTALKSFFHQHFSVTIDKGSDIARACFLCHDPEAYKSDNPTLFDQSFIDGIGSNNFEEIFKRGKITTDRKESFVNGSRHSYITTFAAFLNRTGMDQSKAEMKLLEFQQPGFEAEEIKEIIRRVYQKTELHGVAPLNINNGRDSYTTFPLKLLWVPRDEFTQRIEGILSDGYQHTTGEIPTSIRTSYLIDALDGKMAPELILLIAAVKSIIGMRNNYTRTTQQFVFKRMYGGNPWKPFTEYFIKKLMNTAIERNLLVRISTYPGFYVSIRLTIDEMEKAIMDYYKAKDERKQKAKSASNRISEFRKTISK